MAYNNIAMMNFAGGELSHNMRGRNDIKLYSSSCERMTNFIAEVQGPAKFRTGTAYVSHTRLNQKAVLIPFQFSDLQSYLLEFTNLKMRIYKDGGVVVGADVAITGVTKADPGVVTAVAHGYSNGDEVYIYDVGGMSQLNGKSYIVTNKATDSFELYNIDGAKVNTSGFTTYSSGGVCAKVIEVVTPYTEAQLFEIRWAQNADVMYLTNQNHAPYKLSRSSHVAWTLGTYSRTADPFTGTGAYPRCAAFYEGRLIFASTTDSPETFWLSRSPDNLGNPRYDDFTTGTDPDHALVFTLAPASDGKVDTIRWLAPTDRFLGMGTFGGVTKVTGSGLDEAISPTSIMARHIDTYGVESSPPIATGNITIYVQRGGLILRSLEYDSLTDMHVSIDRNLTSDHITESGVKQVAFQNGRPDVLWCARNDGVLVGLTFKSREDVSGWHRHYLAGGTADTAFGKVLSVGVIPQPTSYDQVWIVAERVIDGVTRRYVEYFTEVQSFKEPIDFYTEPANEAEDMQAFRNDTYERQKGYIHLDSTLSFNGSDRGTAAGATMTPAAKTGTSIVFTASAPVFTAGDVGNQIWKKYVDGIGGGRAVITAYTSTTEVTCNIIKDFDNTDAMPAGAWYLTAGSISGLQHLEGETVGIIADGGVHPDKVVADGSVTLSYEVSVCHIGLRYKGFVKPMAVEIPGQLGNGQTKMKNIDKLGVRFYNTLGARYGTSIYRMEQVMFRSTADVMNRPPPPFSGIKELQYSDEWQREKHVIIEQAQPLPCTIQLIDVYGDVSDD